MDQYKIEVIDRTPPKAFYQIWEVTLGSFFHVWEGLYATPEEALKKIEQITGIKINPISDISQLP